MKKAILCTLALSVGVAVALMSLWTAPSVDAQGTRTLKANLEPFEEVPSISSVAGGEFRARISGDGSSIQYELSYDGLEGDVQQS
ncbi:MAG: hypothetical protein ACRD4T_14390, partial [Candidatus Acidiferrales bacterium]